MFCLATPFIRRQKLVNTKMTGEPSVEFIGYEMRSLIKNICAVLIKKRQSHKVCQHYPVFPLVIFYGTFKHQHRTIPKT